MTTIAGRALVNFGAVLMLVAACGGATPADLVPDIGGPAATDGALATPEGGEATPKPLTVKVTKLTKSVAQGGKASITIKTSKGADCDIIVEYKSGYSTAAGLGPKPADAKGLVTWTWKVGLTTPGSWPITVDCILGDREGSVRTHFRVH